MPRILILVGLLLLAGCGATAAPAPTTAPAAPTSAPATPAAEALTPEAVVAAFTAAGLEAESPTPMSRKDYGMAPLVGTATRFLIPSLGPDNGGRIFVGTPDELDRLEGYYVELGKSSAMLYSHTFRHKNILVQINGDMPDEQAARYRAALESL